MKNNKLLDILKDLGLSENEAKVYLSVLSLGSSTILKIARNADMKRTTIYSVIESLRQKGLILVEMQGIKQLFVAENPENLISILENRKRKFQDFLPEFLALYNLKGGEGFIKYYEGLESVKNIYEELLKEAKPHEDYLVITDQQQWHNLDANYFQKFIEKRAKLNLNIKILMCDSDIARQHKKFEKNYNEQIKILDKDKKIDINLIITPRKLVIHQLVDPIMAIVIENKSIIKMQKQFFDIIWEMI